MGRLIAFVLGGAALVLYGGRWLLEALQPEQAETLLADLSEALGNEVVGGIYDYGPGVFAGLAMILLATRSRG